MKRLKRTAPDARKERTPRDLVRHKVQTVKTTLVFKAMRNASDTCDCRKYYIGVVQIAYVEIYPNSHIKGAFMLMMRSISGNGGMWFHRLENLEAKIVEELTREPL